MVCEGSGGVGSFVVKKSTALVTPAGHTLGPFVILVPVAGALVIGVVARYGSERIRGHGIPEAIEAILIGGSRVEPKVAILKPLSAAISIGSGGPFGAEGPIIMTGGAVGSLVAQFLHLTSAERKTLLVAGAAAGMSATFATPLAAVLLAVELLLFEWKPRSLIPVALASATAAVVRRYIIGLGPLFSVPAHPAFIGPLGIVGCVIAGVLAGGLSALLTQAVYASEVEIHSRHALFRQRIHHAWIDLRSQNRYRRNLQSHQPLYRVCRALCIIIGVQHQRFHVMQQRLVLKRGRNFREKWIADIGDDQSQ